MVLNSYSFSNPKTMNSKSMRNGQKFVVTDVNGISRSVIARSEYTAKIMIERKYKVRVVNVKFDSWKPVF